MLPPESPGPSELGDLADLVERCADGDPAAWDDFVGRFHRRIVVYGLRATRLLAPAGASVAEVRRDLIQDVYVRLLANDRRALRAWRGESEQSFLNYLATIVHAVACDAIKRRRSLKRGAHLVSIDGVETDGGAPLAERIAAPDAASPDRALQERLAPERLNAVLEQAERGPQGRRNSFIFTLYVLDGLTASEIATLPALRMSTANVESSIRRTRERLRSALKDARFF